MPKPAGFKCVIAGAVALVATFAAPARADVTVVEWTFETSAPTSAGPVAAEIGTGTAVGFHASASTAYSSPAGNGSARSFSSNNWSVGDYYQFSFSTLGFGGITVSWDHTSSNTGPRNFTLQYSTNGTSFLDYASYSVLANGASPNAAWNSTTASAAYGFSYDLSSLAALANAPTVYIRLTDASTIAANGGSVATAGTSRVDNFTVTAVPEPGTYGMLLAGFAGLVLLRRRQRGR